MKSRKKELLKKERKLLKPYYLEYYHNHFLRNFRYVFDKEKTFKNGRVQRALNLSSYNYNKRDISCKLAPSFLIRNAYNNDGLLGGEITYYKSLQDFKGGKIETRFCDRLFFDFDFEGSHEVDVIKCEIKKCNDELSGRERIERLSALKQDFRELIFCDDLLQDVFNETIRLCNYLQRFHLRPYLISSGSKGFHINVFFDEMQLTNLSQISEMLARSYSKELNLKHLDFNVFDKTKAHKRLQRVPYSTHSKTNLITRPLPLNITYEDMLSMLKSNKREVMHFSFDEYKAPKGFNNMLLKLDKEISFKNAQRQKDLELINLKKRQELKKKYKGKYQTFNEIDLRDIANAYGINGKSQGDKIIVSCPFHNDKNPSAVIFKERFYCSSCNLTLNYYDFISNLENTTDKHEIMKIARQFLN